MRSCLLVLGAGLFGVFALLLCLPVLASLPWWAAAFAVAFWGMFPFWLRGRRDRGASSGVDGADLGGDRPRWVDLPGGRF